MKCRYITIEREYGSDGTKIAKQLADVCGISCYGKEILEEVSKTRNCGSEKKKNYNGLWNR